MKNFKKSFLIIFLGTLLLCSNIFVAETSARGLFDTFNDGDCKTDTVLPVLVICGRNKTSAEGVNSSCTKYTEPCTFPDLIEIVARVVVFLILLALLIVPLIIIYTGAMLIAIQKFSIGGISTIQDLKDKFMVRILYFILLLAAWLIVRTIVGVFQVNSNINTFLLDENGQRIKASQIIIKN